MLLKGLRFDQLVAFDRKSSQTGLSDDVLDGSDGFAQTWKINNRAATDPKPNPRKVLLKRVSGRRTFKTLVRCCLKGFVAAHAQNTRKVLLKGLCNGVRSKPSLGVAYLGEIWAPTRLRMI